ncbi:MAG: hypothetical protein VXW65_01255 [Pseudomonadota bacterium]|nr:hypothetical protein [Pseudomonadota bacterium]
MAYFSGQGEILLAKVDPVTFAVGSFRKIGNVPEFTIDMDSDQVDHNESTTGQRTKDFVLRRAKSMTLGGQIEDWSPENVSWATNGRIKQITGGAKTGKVSPASLAVGGIWALEGQNITGLTITDSDDPANTVDPADYTLDAAFGTVTMNDVAGYVMPLIAAYTDGDTEAVTFMTDDNQMYALRFQGINTVNQQKVLVELYRTLKNPTGSIPFINEEFGQISIAGEALADISKAVDGDFGLFGRMVYL